MRAISRAVTTTALIVGLAACGGPEPQAIPDPPPRRAPAPDTIFMGAIRVQFPDAIASDTIRLGHTYCDLLDSGVTLERIVSASTANPYLAGYIAGAAIVAYCPAHSTQ